MWEYREEDIVKELGDTNSWIDRSGVYAGTIETAVVVNSQSTKARGINITLATDLGKCRLTFWFVKSDGEENPFAVGQLNRMLFLTKTKKADMKPTAATTNGKTQMFVRILEKKEIGIFVEVKQKDSENRDYNLKDFFEPKTRKTSNEIKSGEEAKKYDYWFERFMDSEIISIKSNKKNETKSQTKKEESVDEEFPF